MSNMKFDYPYKERNDFLKEVVSQLIKRRKELGVTQNNLNYDLGVADYLVAKWENGLRTPTSFHLYCWADALLCDLVITPRDYKPEAIEKQKAINDNITYEVNDKLKLFNNQ